MRAEYNPKIRTAASVRQILCKRLRERALGQRMLAAVIDWRRVREVLRQIRNERGVTLRALEASSGIDESTIHRIENTRKYPNHKPDLETVDAIVRGLNLSLAEFFAQVEPGQELSGATLTANTSPAEAPHSGTPAVSGSAPPHGPETVARATDDYDRQQRRAILFGLSRIAESLERLTALYASTQSQARPARRRQSGRHPDRRKAG